MKKRIKFSLLVVSSFFAINAHALQPGQSAPKRIYSIGDSITRAFDAYLPSDNLNVSWVNGYYGFWQKVLGLPNITSHYQRIVSAYGGSGTSNVTGAVTGATMSRFSSMASYVAGKNFTYVTTLLGANDICSSTIMDIPSDPVFESEFRAGMNQLLNNLSSGATIYVAAIPDVEQVYQIGVTKDALGLVSCKVVWSLNSICQSMLSKTNTDADRMYVKSRIQSFNNILMSVTQEYQQLSNQLGKGLFFSYTSATNDSFTASEVSDIDCFHPSELGQKSISAKTWQTGPFSN